jgi:ATP-grasp domain, R2K clade family 2
VPCLVLTPRLTSDSLHLETAAEKLGWRVHRATRYQLPPSIEDPVVYGELVFCDVMAAELGLGLLEPADWWLSQLPRRYLSRDVQLFEHGDLRRHNRRSFVKPANDKLFEAGIFERGAHVPYRHIDPGMPVLVSDVVSFGFELRCHILDREVVTAGVYAMWGTTESKEAQLYDAGREWLTEVLTDPEVPLPSAVVVDVGYLPEQQTWAVVEANQVCSSGVYMGGHLSERASPGAQPREVLRVLERGAGLRSKVRPEDEEWLRPVSKP